MSRAKTAFRCLAISAGIVVAAPAFAQDAAKPDPKAAPKTDAKPAAAEATKTPAKRTVTTAAPTTTAREDAAKTMPTYEAFGASETESLQETFYRLGRDFQPTDEIGVRRLGAVPVWPRGEMKIGNVRVLPFVRQAVEFESDFYKEHKTGTGGSPNANDASFTHVNQAGFLADTSMAGGRLKLAMSVDAEWDLRYDNGNDSRGFDNSGLPVDDQKDDTFEFDGTLAASYRWPSGVYVRGGYSYERRADPIDADFTGEFQRTNHGAFFTTGMDKDILFGTKFRFELGADMRDVMGRDDELDDVDRTEMSYYFKASYPFFRETTRIFGRARYRQDSRESEQINDGYVLGFDAGIEGSIPISEGEYRALRGQLSVGFDSGFYDSDTHTAGDAEYYNDENDENTSLAINALLQYVMSKKSSVDLRYLRSNEFTYHGNYEIVDRLDLGFNHAINPSLLGRIATYFEYDDPAGRLSPKEVGQDYTTGKYPNTTRFGAGFGLRYAINEWLDADFNFEWERRNNRLDGFVNHRAALGLTLYLNAIKPKARGTMPQ